MTPTSADRTILRPEVGRSGPRLFATAADEPRARRASDAIVLVGSVLGLALTSVVAQPQPGFGRALHQLLTSLPSFLDAVWLVVVDLFVVLALLFVVAALVRRRFTIARDLGISIIVATILWLLLGRIVQQSWPAVWDALSSAEPPPWYPSPRIAVSGAVVMTASPHLALPVRRLGWRLLVLAAISMTVLGATTPLGALAGVLVAAIAASSVHLVSGSCAGRPSLELVRSALAELGVATSSLGAADRQQAGLFLVHATDLRGDQLVVKVYGRDAHDTALLSTLWRSVWYRDEGGPLRLGRLSQVEHEAFLTLFARQAGITTDAVVTAGAAGEDDALLVLRRAGRLLADARGQLDEVELVRRTWLVLRRLHDAGIAHGQLDDRHLLVDGNDVGVVGFRGAALAAGDTQRRTDEVQVFATTHSEVGEELAMAGSLEALGPSGVAAMLPFLQPAVLTPAQRRRARELDLDLDGLRARAAVAIGTEPPALQQLRRVTVGSIVRLALPALGVILLISGLAGLDLDELGQQLAQATWSLVILGFVVTQLPRLTQAISTLGASPVALPLGPVYALQLAVSFVNVAIPTSAARIAVNIRFFQRHGVPPGGAVAAGALDGFGGFVVQAAMLVALLVVLPVSLDLRFGDAADSAAPILLVVVLVVVACAVVIVAVARLRRFVSGWVRRIGAEALDAGRGLRSPRRLALLFGGNLASELLFAIALGTFTRALGFPIGLGELLLVNISVGLLAGLLPVPGGIGVAEGGLTYGLVQAGMPDEVALAAVLMYRLSSFYLPPIWGYLALRWLERNQHL